MSVILCLFCPVHTLVGKIKPPTHCLPQSGRWPLCSPSCLRGWPVPAGRGPNGTAAGPSGWSETCCDPQTDTLWRWHCSRRCPLLAWSSDSTGTRSRCDSGWGCSPVAPTEGPAAAAGSRMLSGRARHAWALRGTREAETRSTHCKWWLHIYGTMEEKLWGRCSPKAFYS